MQGVRCQLLKSKDVKIWIDPDPKYKKPYLLFNVQDAKKRKDGTHGPEAITSDVEYFIR